MDVSSAASSNLSTGQQQAAAGVRIDPENRHERALKAELELFEMVFENCPATTRTFDGEAGGLVDYERFAVFEVNVEGSEVC